MPSRNAVPRAHFLQRPSRARSLAPTRTQGTAALNIANYHTCQRYDFDFGPTHTGGGGALGDKDYAGAFASFFTAYLDDELKPTYLCPPKVYPIDWSVAVVHLLSFAALIEALLNKFEAAPEESTCDGRRATPASPKGGPEEGAGNSRTGTATDLSTLRFRRGLLAPAPMVCVKAAPSSASPQHRSPPLNGDATLPRPRSFSHQRRLVLSALGGAAGTTMLWLLNPALLSCTDTATLVLAVAMPLAIAKGLGGAGASTTKRALETAAAAPLAAAAVNPEATFQLIKAASYGMGLSGCAGACCSAPGA